MEVTCNRYNMFLHKDLTKTTIHKQSWSNSRVVLGEGAEEGNFGPANSLSKTLI